VQTVLYPMAKTILPRLTTCVFSKAENWGLFYDPPGINISLFQNKTQAHTIRYDTCKTAQMHLQLIL